MPISESEYAERLAATEEMSVEELGAYVRDVLRVPPPDDEPGWHVRVEYVDGPGSPVERFTWQRTLYKIIAPEDLDLAEPDPESPEEEGSQERG